MDKLRRFLYENNKKSPVLVPRLINDMVTRHVIPLSNMTSLVECLKISARIMHEAISL